MSKNQNKNKTQLKWKREARKLSDLTPADYNPRKMTEKERTDLIDSVQEFGAVVPIVVNTGKRSNVIIGGHQRSEIYKELGYIEVDVLVPETELSIQDEKRLNLRLNKNTGSWDYEKLKDMDLVTLLDVGFEDDDLQVFFDDVEMFEDDWQPPKNQREQEEVKTVPGQVWQLGEHRVMCGNAMEEADVQKLMGDQLADMAWIDPPRKLEKTLLDAIEEEKTKSGKHAYFLDQLVENARQAGKPNQHLFLWTDEREMWLAQSLLSKHGATNKRMLLWIQSDMKLTTNVAFNKVYEACAYATVGEPHLNGSQRHLNQILNKEVSPGNQVPDDILELMSIWVDKKLRDNEYDTSNSKPVTLTERPLKRCTAPGHLVLDLCGGTGSMLIGCQQLNRICYTIEKDPALVDQIVKRWEELTNKKAKAL